MFSWTACLCLLPSIVGTGDDARAYTHLLSPPPPSPHYLPPYLLPTLQFLLACCCCVKTGHWLGRTCCCSGAVVVGCLVGRWVGGMLFSLASWRQHRLTGKKRHNAFGPHRRAVYNIFYISEKENQALFAYGVGGGFFTGRPRRAWAVISPALFVNTTFLRA